MKRIIVFLGVFFLVLVMNAQVYLVNGMQSRDCFQIASPSHNATIYCDGQEPEVVKKAANLFTQDVQLVTGKKLPVISQLPDQADNLVLIGTLGENMLLDKLVKDGKIDVSHIRNGWEQYHICLVSHPFPGVKKALVVVGCDRRGTAYGVFSISEAIGISPWYWWADVPVVSRKSIILKVNTFSSEAPSVKYRGIFINDEDWGLKPWASKTFDPELGDIGPKSYAKICELLLRLKANYLCPAMHACTKAFNYYAENKLVADSFAIVMGSVHCEPLLFNNASEWDRKKMGEWNYVTNKDGINQVLRKRVSENGKYENVYTLAMRGIHDAVMAGNLSLDEQVNVLERAFADQRDILQQELKLPVSQIPQVFTPYKEVLDIYDRGMNLSDDVTLVWSDDDFGYMKRLSNSKEQSRSGRSGVYYHVSYWGPPKHYLWIASTPPVLMYEELQKAYRSTADRLWVVNVGDIKPAEYPITLFMDMAYNMNRFSMDNVHEHSVDFLCKIFGEKYRMDFEDIQFTYFRLAFIRKPEYMERSGDTDFSILDYREAERRLAEYQRIVNRADKIRKELSSEFIPAFFQLVYYNVKGAALVNQMTLEAQRCRLYASQKRATANRLRDEVKLYGDTLILLTEQYNSILGGKWKGMMSLVHGGARFFERARVDSVDLLAVPTLGICCESENLVKSMPQFHQLPGFNRYLPERSYYVDVYNKGEGVLVWNAVPSDDWIELSRNSGECQYEDRIYVHVNWEKVSVKGKSQGTIEITTVNGEKEIIHVYAFHPLESVSDTLEGAFVENNGYVSIDATDFHRKHETAEIQFTPIKGLGMEGYCIRLGDPFALTPYLDNLVLTSNYVAPVRGNAFPSLEYDFYTFQSGMVDVYTYVMPTFPLDNEHGTRYGVMVDNSPVYLPEAGASYYSTPWIQSVLRNCRINKTTHYLSKPGKHTLKIFCAHPGVLLQKIVIDLGGMKRSYMGPEATKITSF